MGHKCYIRKDSGGATLSETYVNLATGMAADFDRLTGFMEAERPTLYDTRRTENRGWLDELDRPLSGATYSYSARPCAPLPIKDCLQWDSAWHKLARQFKGIKSLELKLWSRAIRYKNNR